MLKNFIHTQYPFAVVGQTVGDVLSIMEGELIDTIPVIKQEEEQKLYVGIFHHEDLLDLDESTIIEAEMVRDKVAATISTHLFDGIALLVKYQSNILPVVDEKNQLIGCITAFALHECLANAGFLIQEGGITVIEINIQDYSLATLTRIIEAEGVKILALINNVNTHTGTVTIHLKLNTVELGAMLQAFDRFQFDVKAVYGYDHYYDDILERYQSFMKFINM
jgi:acetoin utilization protein AcuB